MQTVPIGVSTLQSSRLAYGCWRIAGNPGSADPVNGAQAVVAAYEAGYTLFDNADVYGRGEAERILGKVLKDVSGMRERVVIATKCGVQHAGDPGPDFPHRWNFSADHIIQSCERSLQRLGIETIDLFLLHRPDYLADPQEIARAFSQLRLAGKVRWFGVSNFRTTLLTAVQVACPMPIVAHQVEISLAKLDAFNDGTLDQCMIENITPMAWSPLAAGLIGSGARRLLPAQAYYQPDRFLPVLDAIAAERGVSRVTIALAWLLKHPSRIMPVVGSTNPARIRDAAKSPEVELTREDWYRLLNAARGDPLP